MITVIVATVIIFIAGFAVGIAYVYIHDCIGELRTVSDEDDIYPYIAADRSIREVLRRQYIVLKVVRE